MHNSVEITHVLSIEELDLEFNPAKTLKNMRVNDSLVLAHVNLTTTTQSPLRDRTGLLVIHTNRNTVRPKSIMCDTLIFGVKNGRGFIVDLYQLQLMSEDDFGTWRI
jgi:hypothetical protein